jgi:hypothetical protein
MVLRIINFVSLFNIYLRQNTCVNKDDYTHLSVLTRLLLFHSLPHAHWRSLSTSTRRAPKAPYHGSY